MPFIGVGVAYLCVWPSEASEQNKLQSPRFFFINPLYLGLWWEIQTTAFMKFVLPFLLCGFISFGQSLTEKWNQYQNRYEYFNSSNQLVGYKKYNTYTRSWEYYDEKPVQQRVRTDENFELWTNVAAARQQRYDYNRQRIVNTVNEIYKYLEASDYSRDEYLSVLAKFQVRYVEVLAKSSYDISIDSKADEIIKWLYNGAAKIMEEQK